MYGSALILAALLFAAPAPTTPTAQTITLKSGLWEIDTTTTTHPSGAVVHSRSFLCRSSAYDDFAATQLSIATSGCATVRNTTQDNVHTVLSACKLARSSTETVFTALSPLLASSDADTSYNPALTGVLARTIHEDQHYVAACPSYLQPGDFVPPTGAVQHLWTSASR